MLKRIKETLTCTDSGGKRKSRIIHQLKLKSHLLHSDKSDKNTYFYKGKVRDFFKSRLTPTQPCTNGVWCASPHCDKVNTPTVSTLANRTQRSQDITPYSAAAGRANMLGNSRFSTIPLVLSAFGLLLVLGLSVGCVGRTSIIGGSDSIAYAEEENEAVTLSDNASVSLSLADTANNGNMTITDNNKSIQEQVDATNNTGYIAVDFHVTATNIDKYDVYVQSSNSALIGETNKGKVESISSDTTYANMVNNTGWGYAVAEGSNVNAETLTYKPIQTSASSAVDSGSATNTTVNKDYTLAFAANLTGATADHYKSNITLSVAAGASEVVELTQYSLKFSGNGNTSGNVPITQSAETEDSSYSFTIPQDNNLLRINYGFAGWSENPNATSPEYTLGGTITLGKTNPSKTLYAIWQPGLLLIDNMQQMTSAGCAEGTSIGDTKQLIDSRDKKKYWVTKLADNNCWMTQNLDLDIPTSGLKAIDTDIVTDWTPTDGETTISTGNLSILTWPNDSALIRSYDPGEYVYTKGAEISNCGEDQTSLAGCSGWESYTGKTASGDPNFGNATTSTNYNGHYTAGNYYNYNAATAGTGLEVSTNNADASGSICPKGWQLPYSGRDNFVDNGSGVSNTNNNVPTKRNKGFVNLFEAYGWGNWNRRDAWGNPYENSITGTINDVTTNIASAPLYFLRSGIVYNYTPLRAGYESDYWSTATNSVNNAYHLYFNSSYVSPSNYSFRYLGLSVRCVAR